jgi:hypothetical protein
LNNDQKAIDLLKQNTYYFLPVVNVDGLAAIEQDHNLYGKTTAIMSKRKNSGPAGSGSSEFKDYSCFNAHFDGKE